MSLYDTFIPQVAGALSALTSFLKKAESHASSSTLPTSRIYPDMYPLSMQVYLVTNIAQNMISRLAGVEPLKLERDLETFADFYARIKQITDLLASVGLDKAAIDARGDPEITLDISGEQQTMRISRALRVHGISNLYFHLTTALNILRMEGVELGKADYLYAFLEGQ